MRVCMHPVFIQIGKQGYSNDNTGMIKREAYTVGHVSKLSTEKKEEIERGEDKDLNTCNILL